GMALLSSLLAMAMLLALGMAIVISATTDTVTNKSARLGSQAFFAADAGIGIARRALEKAFSDRLLPLPSDLASRHASPYIYALNAGYPDTFQLLPDPDTTDGQACTFYSDVKNNAQGLTCVSARDSRFDTLNSTSFSVNVSSLTGTLSLSPVAGSPNTDPTKL